VAGLGLRLEWALLSMLRLRLETGVYVPLSARPRFSVAGYGPLTEAQVVAGYGRLALGVRF
jgi:hypothetical protein